MKRRIILIIMDGWGLRAETEGNAVARADTPVLDKLWNEYPHTTLDPSGAAVGLPKGQMGNSEVGHLNLGAGRVVSQDIVRISRTIDSGDFFKNPALLEAIRSVSKGGTLHLMGLLSDGGVHSLQSHLHALIDMARQGGLSDVCIHAFMDGRDTSPTNGKRYLANLQTEIDKHGVGRVATVIGRYYAMDRDKRWDRTRCAYNALTNGDGYKTPDYQKAVEQSYDRGVTDEFIEPIVVIGGDGQPVGIVREGDAVIFFNFRADRARQMTSAFTGDGFDGFERTRKPVVKYVCMTEYDEAFGLDVAFHPARMKNILAEAAAGAGATGLRIAETEKYAHVTYFFNGGEETAFAGEERILIPSPKVATYDLKPEMSALEVADTLIDALGKRRHDYVICNFANPDMVGHTGVLDAAVKAVETVDTCVGRVIDSLDLDKDAVIVTADHGNAEMMIDPDSGGPHTAHTTNPVPCILVDRGYTGRLIKDGSLCDIAPTICNYLGIKPPEEMTGRDLRMDV